MLKKCTVIAFLLLISYTNLHAKWYENCKNTKMQDIMMKVYKTNFYTLHQIAWYQWAIHEVKYKVEPYSNSSSYFGNNKHVRSSTFTVIAQSINDLKKHKFEVGFSILFKETKNKKGEIDYESRVDFTKQLY